jgi:hypothetical protein
MNKVGTTLNTDLSSALTIGKSAAGNAGAIAARDAALERVAAAAGSEWNDRAYEAVQRVCFNRMYWTSENVWDYVEKPREPRALGPVLKRAVRDGWCEPVGFVTSSMSTRHAAPVRQYRSLITGGN